MGRQSCAQLLIKLAQLQAVVGLLLTLRQMNYVDEAMLVYAVEVSEAPNSDAAGAVEQPSRAAGFCRSIRRLRHRLYRG